MAFPRGHACLVWTLSAIALTGCVKHPGSVALGSLEVVVRDNTGLPLSGTLISTNRKGLRPQTTDDAGLASWREIETGTISLSVTKTGYAPLETAATVIKDKTTRANIVVSPLPSGDYLQGLINNGVSWNITNLDSTKAYVQGCVGSNSQTQSIVITAFRITDLGAMEELTLAVFAPLQSPLPGSYPVSPNPNTPPVGAAGFRFLTGPFQEDFEPAPSNAGTITITSFDPITHLTEGRFSLNLVSTSQGSTETFSMTGTFRLHLCINNYAPTTKATPTSTVKEILARGGTRHPGR